MHFPPSRLPPLWSNVRFLVLLTLQRTCMHGHAAHKHLITVVQLVIIKLFDQAKTAMDNPKANIFHFKVSIFSPYSCSYENNCIFVFVESTINQKWSELTRNTKKKNYRIQITLRYKLLFSTCKI